MRCPYLKEANVSFCRNAAWRKMIVREDAAAGEEKCSSPSYTSCQIYRQCDPNAPADPPCPYLEKGRAEYCAAAPVAKLVPQTEVSSRCKHDCHRYCELFRESMPRRSSDGVEMPEGLYYSANHLWFDPAGDGCWHVGIDALLAKAIGAVDAVTFVTLSGTARPAVVLDVNGLHFEVVFPNPLAIGGANLHLRADPSELTADPYGMGWLFEGVHRGDMESATRGLMRGREVTEWMRRDLARIAERAGGDSMADGGVPCDLLRRLEGDRALPLFHEFFSLSRVGSGA
jgi:glycine cleavage system H lipoate-binding protein